VDVTQPSRLKHGNRKDVTLNRFVSTHHAVSLPPRATRSVVILVVIIIFTYVVGNLAGDGGAIAIAAAAAVAGVVTERLTRLILRHWVCTA
jgi:hypothetical protein